jgi:hypothetical protein
VRDLLEGVSLIRVFGNQDNVRIELLSSEAKSELLEPQHLAR